jgi:hypothetical protein
MRAPRGNWAPALVAALLGVWACGRGRGLVGRLDAPGDAAPEGAPGDADRGRDAAAGAALVDGADGPDAAEAGDVSDGDADAADDELSGLPLPAGVEAPRRLLDGMATLTGNGRTACSHAEPASGDGHRWCAFRLPNDAGTTELWVMDVSAAAAGASLECDGNHPACQRLTANLWAPYSNDFEGDTLIFYADAPATLRASQPFVGSVYAWRPGWLAARVIAAHATVCSGAAGAPVALCLDDPRGEPSNPDDVALRVGFLADLADARLPALPGRWPLRSDGSVPWQVGFSPDGQTFALSVPDAGPFDASLYAIATRDVGKGTAPGKIVPHIQPWTISNDGRRVFFYRGPRSDATLVSAAFPAGGDEVTLATAVVDYLPIGRRPTDLALLLRVRDDAGGHDFRLLRDRARPATAQTLFTNDGFLEGVLVSPDLRYTAWIDPDFRGRSIRVGDLATCALNPAPAPSVGDLTFLDDASLLFWSQARPDAGGARDGYLAPPDTCGPRTRFARGLGFLATVGARGVVYGDARDDAARTVTLKYAPLPNGRTDVAAAGGVRVHGNVWTPVTLVAGATSPTSLHVLFRAEGDGAKESGLYLFGPVPF